MKEQCVELLKEDRFEECLQLLCHNADKFAHEDRKKMAVYCLSSMPEVASDVFYTSKVKNDTDMMKYAYQHVNLSINNKFIYAIELGLEAVVEKLCDTATNLDFGIYKCMTMDKLDLARVISNKKEERSKNGEIL